MNKRTTYFGGEQSPSIFLSNPRLLGTAFVLILVSTFFSCSNSNTQGEVLFNNLVFKKLNNESVIYPDSSEKSIYTSFIEDLPFQIPLFKCIKAEDYYLYIGLPINASIKEIYQYSLQNSNKNIRFETDSLTYFYSNGGDKGQRFAAYSTEFESNIIYVLMTGQNNQFTDSLFDMKSITNRFTK